MKRKPSLDSVNVRSHAAFLIPCVVGAFIIMTPSGCSTIERSSDTTMEEAVSSESEPISESMVVGDWTVAVQPTADVLARAQFGTQQTITVKAGATRPETNTVARPFNQKKYDEYRASCARTVKAMQWHLRLNSDHTGQLLFMEEVGSNEMKSSPVKWELLGTELRLVYPEEKRFNTFTCRMVSNDELHYPMEPLGGWFVMRRQ